MSTPRIRNLLRQADKVAASGKKSAALDLYRQVIDEDESNALAWLGLGKSLDAGDEKRRALDKALALDPDNQLAANEIALLDGQTIPYPDAYKEEEQNTTVGSWIESEAPSNGVDQKEIDPVREAATSGKVEPIVGGVFPHPVDISEFVLPDGSMVSYKSKIPTTLRCNRCGRPISSKDSKKTSVGYRCLICIAEIEESYYEATTMDYVISIAVATFLAILAGFLITFFRAFGFFFLFILFFIGGGIGTAIARTAHRAAGRRRGRYTRHIIPAIIAVGGILPTLLFSFSLFGLLGPIIYAFSATSAAYYFLK